MAHRVCCRAATASFVNSSICASVWLVKDADITKVGWPMALPRFTSRPSERRPAQHGQKRPGSSGIAVVHLVRNVLVGLVGEQQGRADADRRADTDVEADRERGMICREQPGRD